MAETSYQALVIKELTKFIDNMKAKTPDKGSNRGTLVTEAFLWDTIEKYAGQNSEAAWAALVREEIVEPKENYKTPGDFTASETPAFSVQVKVTEPRKGFKAEVLQETLKKKYRVPLHTSKEMIEAAKVPGNPVRTFRIVER